MKLLFTVILFISCFFAANAQVVNLNNNKNLAGINVGSQVLLISYTDSSLWKIDVANSAVQYSTKAYFEIDEAFIEISNDKLFLNGRNDEYGAELWVTDGTDEGTKFIKDINPGTEGSNIHFLAEMNGLVFFAATTFNYGKELWVTDGTNEGTKMVKDIVPGTEGINVGFERIINNGRLFLIIDDGIHGYELWRTDGTEAGTFMVKDINPTLSQWAGSKGSLNMTEGQTFFNSDTTILFAANTGFSLGLWKSDGTESGTVMLATIEDSTYASSGTYFLSFNDKIFFNVRSKLWVTDGSEEGSYLIKDLGPYFSNDVNTAITLSRAMIFNNKFLFTIRTGGSESEYQIWSSDGTEAGTTFFFKTNNYTATDIRFLPEYDFYKNASLYAFSDYIHISPFNGKAFFYTKVSSTKNELWITDGLTTSLLRSNFKFKNGDYVDQVFYRFDSSGLLFAPYDDIYGAEPWNSDGTVQGTKLISDINTGSGSSNPFFQFKYNGQQYFWADDGDNTEGFYDLFKIGGTLPVSLLSFTAVLKNTDAVLNWKTATEYNVSRFIIQRSKDGANFSDIGSVNARNTGVQQQQYFYTDKNAFAGSNAKFYYRLKTLDKDGKFTLSKTVVLTKSGNDVSVSISPNPVKNILTINYSVAGASSNALKITDANGHIVFVRNNLAANSAGQQVINIGGLSKGVYYIQLIAGTSKKSTAFIKE